MNLLEDLQLFDDCKKEKVWDLGNEVLYNLCSANPEHKADKIIVAKVWLIGRSYSVALERNKKKERETNDAFYEKNIVSVFKNSDLDKMLTEFRGSDPLLIESLKRSIEIHSYLTNVIYNKLTEHKNRSFSSKYLHFHLPHLFYIYDSLAVSALNSYVKRFRIQTELKSLFDNDEIDKDYAQFACKCFYLQKRIYEDTGIELQKRHLDNFLLDIANDHLNRTWPKSLVAT
jgi:hypothetical protein